MRGPIRPPCKLEKTLLRPGQCYAFHLGPLRNGHRLKAALQMQVNFRLGKRIN